MPERTKQPNCMQTTQKKELAAVQDDRASSPVSVSQSCPGCFPLRFGISHNRDKTGSTPVSLVHLPRWKAATLLTQKLLIDKFSQATESAHCVSRAAVPFFPEPAAAARPRPSRWGKPQASSGRPSQLQPTKACSHTVCTDEPSQPERNSSKEVACDRQHKSLEQDMLQFPYNLMHWLPVQ